MKRCKGWNRCKAHTQPIKKYLHTLSIDLSMHEPAPAMVVAQHQSSLPPAEEQEQEKEEEELRAGVAPLKQRAVVVCWRAVQCWVEAVMV